MILEKRGFDDVENVSDNKRFNFEMEKIDITDLNFSQYNLLNTKILQHVRSFNFKNRKNFERILNNWGKMYVNNFIENGTNNYHIFYNMINLESLTLNNCMINTTINFLDKCNNLKTLIIVNDNINLNEIISIHSLPKSLKKIIINGINLKYVPVDVFNCILLEYLDISANNIYNISGDISNLKYLNYLNISSNPIKNLPEELGELIHLEYFNISKTFISTISTIFNHLVHLKELYANNCKIENIIGNISKTIQKLNLSKNIITSIPKYFSDFENLELLSLERNGIYEFEMCNAKLYNLKELYLQLNLFVNIPKWVYNCINLVTFNISGNNINYIDNDIGRLIHLESLNLYSNILKTIPIEISNLKNLKFLSLKNNFIENIPIGIFSSLEKLVILIIDENYLTSLPDDILSLGKTLKHISYSNNSFVNMSKRIKMFIEMVSGQKENFIYTDQQSVHDRNIQQSFIDSVKNLQSLNLEVNFNKIFNEWIVDPTLSSNCKDEIYKMFCDKTSHVTLNMSYRDIFNLVWAFIHSQEISGITPEVAIEIKTIMSQGIIDVANMCFTGKTTMLINCLCGFTDKVNIGLSENEELANIIIAVKRQLISRGEYSVELHKEKVIKNMKERGVTDEVISVWVDNITEE